MRRLWTEEEVTFQGRHFQLEKARMVLKPVQKPHPPVWVAANSDAAIKRAASRGFTWYVNPHATYETIARQVKLYHDTAAKAGVGDAGAAAHRPGGVRPRGPGAGLPGGASLLGREV